MTTEDMIRALGNVIEEYKNKPVFTGQTNIPIMCRDVIDKLKELSNPWKTGTPSEKGDYLCVFQSVWAVEYYWCYWDGAWDIYFDDYDPDTYTIVAWMPIPSYEEKKNG